MNHKLKIVIAGTNDLIDDPISGVRQVNRELYEVFEKSRISISPLILKDQKRLCKKLINVLRIAGTISEMEEGLIASKIDDILNNKEFKKGYTVRDLIKEFISYVEMECKHDI